MNAQSYSEIAGNTDDIAKDTKDTKFLVDVAERLYVNNINLTA